LDNKNADVTYNLFRFGILFYWSLFWLINSIDKIIGGSQFLWVGKDRFAQFQRFFASVHWENTMVANVALIIVAALEIFAFLFFTGALLHLIRKNQDLSRSWFVIGICFTLATFTIFSIGDHIFGDRFELLEHTLFWFITLFSWVAYIHADKFVEAENFVFTKRQLIAPVLVLIALAMVANISIFKHKNEAFHERREGVLPEMEGENLYKFSFPFLAGSGSFEKSIKDFKQNNPDKRIIEVYTVPEELRKQKADGLVIYILTGDKN
jgi:hypothetical protein